MGSRAGQSSVISRSRPQRLLTYCAPLRVYNLVMVRTHLFFKVEIEHGEEEDPEKVGEEIGRHLRKLYVVRSVELSSVVTQPE